MEVLTHPMLDQFAQLGLTGMAQAFAELEASGEAATLIHADWLALLIDREMTHRRDKRLAARLRYARLRHHAVVEDVDYRVPRGLDRASGGRYQVSETVLRRDGLSDFNDGCRDFAELRGLILQARATAMSDAGRAPAPRPRRDIELEEFVKV
jgi:DNA replication protein DnaC